MPNTLLRLLRFSPSFLIALGAGAQLTKMSLVKETTHLHTSSEFKKKYLGIQNSNKESQQITPKKQDNNTTKSDYFIEVYLTDMNNGPGHISTSFIKKSDNKIDLMAHTSYMPGVGALISGISLGCVPVPARNFSPDAIRPDDVNKATRIIRIPVSQQEFDAGVAMSAHLNKRTDSGTNLYAITGKANPIACFLTAFCNSLLGVHLTSENIKKKTGVYPAEDHNQMSVYRLEDMPENYQHVKVYNCSSAVQRVLSPIFTFQEENNVFPADVFRSLERQAGAEPVQDSLIPVPKDDDLELSDNNEDNKRPRGP